MKNYLPFALCLFCFSLSGQAVNYADLCKRSKEESLIPVRPGIPGKQPFWNEHARIFHFAPAFNFKSFDNVAGYNFSAFSFTDNQYYTFTADNPYAPLTPVWDKIPDGRVYLTVEAVSRNINTTYISGSGIFVKTSAFCPPYPPSQYSYHETAVKTLQYLYNLKHIKDWYVTGKPDHQAYFLYCYPAKILRGIMEAMMMHYDFFKNDTALVIARKAADYLLVHSEPAGAPLEFFPQTYEGEGATAKEFNKQIIMMEPSATGPSYLDLYKKTKDKKYYQAAVNIANTFVKTQLPSGTWYIRILKETGEPASDVYCIPIQIINFLTLMAEEYGQKQYLPAAEKAMKWMWENPMKTWNWTGQFEDVPAGKPYEDLTKYEAGWMAWYLLDHKDKDPSYLPLAKELVAFCEDQFVLWNKTIFFDSWETKSDHWHTPSAMEQYWCYEPIDASVTMMALTFMKAYKATNDSMYKEKAIALTNSIVNVQQTDGLIPTFWLGRPRHNWINCMIFDLRILNIMDKESSKK